MIILGLNGGIAMQFEDTTAFGAGQNHDAAAALLIDGEVVAAIEEERIDRIKHTHKFPYNAINSILEEQQLTMDEVDFISLYTTEAWMEGMLKMLFWTDPSMDKIYTPREYISDFFDKAFGSKIDHSKICFVDHHLCHAASTYFTSGFDRSLILTIDAEGTDSSGEILYAEGNEMIKVDSISIGNSVGSYYLTVIKLMGYVLSEEYKVMGLAPYGDPSKYRDVFSMFYNLMPDGKFEIYEGRTQMLMSLIPPESKGKKYDAIYKDLAAALQESLENIMFHILAHHAKQSGFRKLCLAGGVAQNCSAAGKVLNSGLFEEIYVMPASYDAGNSIGSAAYTYMQQSQEKKIKRLEHVYLGTKLPSEEKLVGQLEKWKDFIRYEKVENIEKKAAASIHEGKIIGWVQGRSEFGPRALGNRSILADPRPAQNKDIINKMVKKREAYRPFAPSVLHEKSGQYFDVNPDENRFDFMTFVVNVREEYHDILGAVTHVDGTARIQTVKKENNPRYWNLISEFEQLSGVPILLNTSFNNNAEPIVNSPNDAITCFLTTDLDNLVIGDYYLSKKHKEFTETLEELVPNLPVHSILSSRNLYNDFVSNSIEYGIGFNHDKKYDTRISKNVFELISQINGEESLKDLMSNIPLGQNGERTRILKEIEGLWGTRHLKLLPK